ncbi:MAG TPA: ABC transporter substrate-binding protein [Candidatus Tectomicrobia bacterium]|nr:ABC transporter substrate-binding protein [Candidatus Tectomicrobia bacterium]
MSRWWWTCGALAAMCASLLAGPAGGQEPIKVAIARLAFPSLTTLMVDVVKDQGLDRKNGIDLEPKSFGAVSAYYAAAATGEVDMLPAGPHVIQKMRTEGVPIKATLTYARLNALAVITGDPAVKSIADLRGKSIAADMGSSEYQILALYGRRQGIVFGTDVTVVQAGPPLARTQLQARRVDAAMTWEPTATLTLRDNPQYRTILTGDIAWRAIANTDGWELVIAAREDFLKRSPDAVPRLMKMFQDGARFITTNTDQADRIVSASVKLPPGILKEAVAAGRIVYDIRPAWEGERAVLWEMFKVAVDSGYLSKLPDEGVIYRP